MPDNRGLSSAVDLTKLQRDRARAGDSAALGTPMAECGVHALADYLDDVVRWWA